MLIVFFFKVAAAILGHTPDGVLRPICAMVGRLLYAAYPKRRRAMLTNLAKAFPSKSMEERSQIARESCVRMIETGLLAVAAPAWSEAKVRARFSLSPKAQAAFEELRTNPRPVVFGIGHLAYWEALTWLPLAVPGIPFGSVYRAFRNKRADDYLRSTRERFGVKLLSRKSGIHLGAHILRERGGVGILFDQNAGGHGALTTFFGEICSTTELPGMLAERFGAEVWLMGTRRLGFFRAQIFIEPIPAATDAAGITIQLNRTLEKVLRADDDLCASWLWMHNRWKIQSLPEDRARVEQKRNLLPEEARLDALARH